MADKEAGAQLLKERLPGRLRLDLQVYMGSPSRAYKPVPGHAIYGQGVSAAEARRLWAKVKTIVQSGEWRDKDSTATTA